MTLGLILSSSDFFIVNETDPSSHPATRWSGGVTGSACLNSTLSDPITNANFYSRMFTSTNANECFGGYLVKESVDGGIYSSSLGTSKAYSMRAWLRVYNGYGNQADHCGVGLAFMAQSEDYITHGSDVRFYHLGGYTLQFSGMKQDNSAGDAARPHLYIGTNEVSGTINGSFPPIECSGGTGGSGTKYSLDEWHRVRFDMIPVGGSGVTLNAYTSSAGDVASGQEVWEKVGSTWVNSTDAIYIDPSLQDIGMGFYAWKDGAGDDDDTLYIDQFEILVQDI